MSKCHTLCLATSGGGSQVMEQEPTHQAACTHLLQLRPRAPCSILGQAESNRAPSICQCPGLCLVLQALGWAREGSVPRNESGRAWRGKDVQLGLVSLTGKGWEGSEAGRGWLCGSWAADPLPRAGRARRELGLKPMWLQVPIHTWGHSPASSASTQARSLRVMPYPGVARSRVWGAHGSGSTRGQGHRCGWCQWGLWWDWKEARGDILPWQGTAGRAQQKLNPGTPGSIAPGGWQNSAPHLPLPVPVLLSRAPVTRGPCLLRNPPVLG